MPETNAFVQEFEDLVKNKDEKAIKVINAIADYCKNEMAAQNVVNLFFADHGWEHSIRLSHYASFMVGQLKDENKSLFSDIEWNNMLVLLWTAIALHDIGMNDIAKYKEADLIEIIKEQVGRIDHVSKSGEWIARIIDDINHNKINDDISKFVRAWMNYWDDQQTMDSITALRMVKDIVLMHGEEKNWLVEDKIGALDRNVFSDIDEKDKDIYRTIISYNEALLCLSDLLDICKERMMIFSNDEINRIFNQLDANKRRLTFEHWVSHNITSVNKDDYEKDGYFKLEMYRYSVDSKMYLNNILYSMYPELGAVEACLKWGNDERLKGILQNFGYNGIKISFRRQNATVWRTIHAKADKFKIYDNVHILKVNSQLEGTTNSFINDLISRWIQKNWSVEEESDFYRNFKSIYEMFSKGVSLHILYDKKVEKINKDSIGFFVEVQDVAGINYGINYGINDILLSAINMFFEVCKDRENIHNVQIVAKGDGIFSSLYSGTNNDKETGYIIIIRNYLEDDLNRIIETIKKKDDSSFAIFICTAGQVNSGLRQNCQNVQYIINKDKFDKIKLFLKDYALKEWTDKDEISEKEEGQAEELLSETQIGLGEFIKRLEIIYNGMHTISESVISDLKKNKYGGLFVLNLFEMMSKEVDRRREIENKELEFFYNEFYIQNRSKIYQMSDYKEAKELLSSLCEENDGKIRLQTKYSSSFENLIVSSSREMDCGVKQNLFQMMIFFWLYNYRMVNFKSVCYREYLTYLSPKQLCSYILNPNIDLVERINICFETSEILVDELKQKAGDDTLREFINQYIIELLNDRMCLLENEDIICFQSIYRIFRGILAPNMEDNICWIIDIIRKSKSHVGYLGFIEGVCSANLDEDRQLEKIVKTPLEKMLREIFAGSELHIQYMTYDILFNYKKDGLRKEFICDDWEKICGLLHGKGKLEEKDKNSVYIEWEKMRLMFMNILKETSESIRKRNMFDTK